MATAAVVLGAAGCTDPPGETPSTGSSSETSETQASTGGRVDEGSTSTGEPTSSAVTLEGTTTLEDTSSTTTSEGTTSEGTTTSGTTSEGTTSGTTTGTTGGVDPLVAQDDGPYLVEASAVLMVDAVQGVLSNDVGSSLVVVAHDPVSSEGGLVTVQADGSFTYDPPAGLAYGTDRFTYTVEDDLGQSAVAEARIAVQPAGGVVSLGGLGDKGVRIEGSGINVFCGWDVAGAGDVDGDGHADVLVGAYGASPMGVSNAGESYLLHGGTGLPATLSVTAAAARFRGIDELDWSGRALSGAGDVNGDGYADLLVGAPLGDPGGINGAGETYLVYGGPALPASSSLAAANVRLDGAGFGSSGAAVSGAGDVNGDGYADLLVGAYAAWPNGVFEAGESYLVLGGPALPAVVSLANAAARFRGIDESDRSGIAVSGAGDVDGDGYADVLVGAYWADSVAAFGGPFGGGQAYLVRGAPSLPAVIGLADADVRFDGVGLAEDVGWSVSGAGDVNGDGYGDVLLGDRYLGATTQGGGYLFYGEPVLPAVLDTDAADVRFEGIAQEDAAGQDVSGAGDVNGDGYADLLLGANMADPGGASNAGESYLVLGGPALPAVLSLADADVRLPGVDANDWSGHAVSGAGDVDGDGYADLLVGAPQGDPNAMFGVQNSGEIYLVLGDDLTGTTSVLGTPGDDDLWAHGGAIADVVVGGRGHDVLRCDGGADVLRGGAGDDTLEVVDDAFFRLDGGLGSDALGVAAGLSLDELALAPSRVIGIERVALALDGASSIVISELALVGLSDTSNTLTVDGDADDEVVLVAGGWTGPVLDGGHMVYGSTTTAAVLRVDPAITVTMP